MTGSLISSALSVLEPVLCLVVLSLVVARHYEPQYRFFCAFLACHFCSTALMVPFFLFGGRGIEPHLAYRIYFWVYWAGFTSETVLAVLLIYSIFDLALVPLDGIRKLGVVVFRWAVCMSLAVVAGSVLLPHASEQAYVTSVLREIQRTESILTLCLLLFVCFAIHPLGLSYRSRIFGISLGLGVLATTKLLVFGWMAHTRQLYSLAGLIDSMATCAALLLWALYFAAPEAKRRIVVLPTTSPLLRWNQISSALGNSPGFVAVGGVPPELFAPAELEVMRRSSLKMREPLGAMEQVAVRLQHSRTA